MSLDAIKLQFVHIPTQYTQFFLCCYIVICFHSFFIIFYDIIHYTRNFFSDSLPSPGFDVANSGKLSNMKIRDVLLVGAQSGLYMQTSKQE